MRWLVPNCSRTLRAAKRGFECDKRSCELSHDDQKQDFSDEPYDEIATASAGKLHAHWQYARAATAAMQHCERPVGHNIHRPTNPAEGDGCHHSVGMYNVQFLAKPTLQTQHRNELVILPISLSLSRPSVSHVNCLTYIG